MSIDTVTQATPATPYPNLTISKSNIKFIIAAIILITIIFPCFPIALWCPDNIVTIEFCINPNSLIVIYVTHILSTLNSSGKVGFISIIIHIIIIEIIILAITELPVWIFIFHHYFHLLP